MLWEGEYVLLTEAFMTLAAGTSGGGEVLLCAVGLVCLHLTAVVGLNCSSVCRNAVWVPFSPLCLLAPAEYVPLEPRETPTEMSTEQFYNFS